MRTLRCADWRRKGRGGGNLAPFYMAQTVSVKRDPLSGLVTRTMIEDNKLVVDYRQDVTAVLERTNRLRNESDANLRHAVKHGGWLVAHIPDSVMLKWRTDHGFDAFKAHPDEIAKMVNRPEYAYLKTTTKRF